MAQRGIERAWVARVLGNPESIEPDRTDQELTHHLGRIAEHEGRVLRVVFKREEGRPLVVTVYFDRAARKRL